jgi:AcrR family transcriptional regulator
MQPFPPSADDFYHVVVASAQAARRRLTFEERRETIIAAAAVVVGERGIDKVRVADVAEAAGVSQPLVSRHFSSRDDLLVAAFAQADRVGLEALAARDAKTVASGAERVLAWLSSVVDDSDPDLVVSRRMWYQAWGCRALSPALTELIRESQSAWVARIEELVENAQADGSAVADVDARAAALQLVTLSDGIPPAIVHGTMTVADAKALLRDAVNRALGARV